MAWAVAQTESQREHVAEKFLKQDNYPTYLPHAYVKVGSRERVLPLFPCYIFVEIFDRWYSIRWTPGVLRLLLIDERPAVVADRAIAKIKKLEGPNGVIRLPKSPGLQPGTIVRVTRGSFAAHIGLYDGMAGPARARVLIELLGRQVPVSLPFRDIVAAETVATACV